MEENFKHCSHRLSTCSARSSQIKILLGALTKPFSSFIHFVFTSFLMSLLQYPIVVFGIPKCFPGFPLQLLGTPL